jgi:hypothetical protein
MTTERKGRSPGWVRLKLYFETLVEGTFRESAEMPGESMTIRRAYTNPNRRR